MLNKVRRVYKCPLYCKLKFSSESYFNTLCFAFFFFLIHFVIRPKCSHL
jgi:hypothetical protein